jgi:hypothetical protein
MLVDGGTGACLSKQKREGRMIQAVSNVVQASESQRVTVRPRSRHRSPDVLCQRSRKDDQIDLIGYWCTVTRVPSLTSSPSRPLATGVLAGPLAWEIGISSPTDGPLTSSRRQDGQGHHWLSITAGPSRTRVQALGRMTQSVFRGLSGSLFLLRHVLALSFHARLFPLDHTERLSAASQPRYAHPWTRRRPTAHHATTLPRTRAQSSLARSRAIRLAASARSPRSRRITVSRCRRI